MAKSSHETQLKSLQIIVFALISGVTLFAGVALAVDLGRDDPRTARVMLYVLAGLAAFNLSAYFMLRNPILKRLRQEELEEESYEEAFQSRAAVPQPIVTHTLVAAAMAESIGLLAVVDLLLTKDMKSLIFIGLSVGAMVLLVPTRERVLGFLREA